MKKGGCGMLAKDLLYLFEMCLDAPYLSVEGGGSFCLIREGERLFVLFEKSNGLEDWENNLDFASQIHTDGEYVAPYSDMEDKWYCHGGFLRVWKSILPYIRGALLDLSFKEIITVGYSHGAALALLCHEYIWYNRRDLRGRIFSFAFGCPRVIHGKVPRERERWDSFYVIRNIDDLVTHLPPSILGFRHVGRLIEIGKRGKYSRVDAHRQENYLRELEILAQNEYIT